MNWRQVIGLLLIILGALAIVLAIGFDSIYSETDIYGIPFYSYPYAGYVLPTFIIGIVLLIVGIVLMAVKVKTEKRSDFPLPLPP